MASTDKNDNECPFPVFYFVTLFFCWGLTHAIKYRKETFAPHIIFHLVYWSMTAALLFLGAKHSPNHLSPRVARWHIRWSFVTSVAGWLVGLLFNRLFL